MTVRLEAGLVGRDLDALCTFYTQVLGFEIVGRLEFDAGTVCKLRRDAARIKIFVPADTVDPAAPSDAWYRPGGWRYAALNLDRLGDVDDIVRSVEASEGRVLMAPTNHRAQARTAMVCDPEGNAWELLAEARDEAGES